MEDPIFLVFRSPGSTTHLFLWVDRYRWLDTFKKRLPGLLNLGDAACNIL